MIAKEDTSLSIDFHSSSSEVVRRTMVSRSFSSVQEGKDTGKPSFSPFMTKMYEIAQQGISKLIYIIASQA